MLASRIPDPYWLFRLRARSESHGSGFGPSGFGGALATGAAGLAAAGGVTGAASAGFAVSAGFAAASGFAVSAGVVTEAAAGGAAGSDVPAGVGLAIAGADGAASMPGLGGSGGLDSGKTGFGSLVSSGIALLLSSTDPGFSLGPFTCISLRRSPSGVRVTWHCDLGHIGAQTRDRGTRQHIQPDKQKTPFARYAANGAGSFYAGRHAGYTHSNAPFFQIQMYPTIRMPRKIIISSSPNKPSSLNCTAQGNRKTVSTSKTTNRMATI